MTDQRMKLLMVDDSEDDVLLVIRDLKSRGFDPIYKKVEDEATMSQSLRETDWDIVLCDYNLPRFSVSAACHVLKEHKTDVPLIVVSGSYQDNVVSECLGLGARDFIAKDHLARLRAVIFREMEICRLRKKCVRLENEMRQRLDHVEEIFHAVLQVMVAAVEARDPFTVGHQFRSASLSSAIAREMGLAQENVEAAKIAASLHDIGKLTTPLEVLSKPSRLTEMELSLVQEHSVNGFAILKDVRFPWPLAPIVHQHHERVDGSGYPHNLKGDEILLEARILAVSDVVESMTADRSYRPAPGIHAALEEIRENRGILYDALVADACLRLFEVKGYQMS